MSTTRRPPTVLNATADDPRRPDLRGQARRRLTEALARHTEAAERSPAWTAEADPADWPDAVDDWFFAVK